jgi:hypothetical protein
LTSLHVSRNWLVPFDALDAASPRGPAAPCWLDLDLDREAYVAQLAELKQRVDTVLRANYGGYELRDGWPIHNHVIRKLSTLAAKSHRTYNGKLPDLPRALEFYERWLPGTMRRVTEYTRACIGQCSASRRLPYNWAGR